MTNPATPPKGGMPKWLIILLIVLLLIMFVCCGGLTMCFFVGRKVVKSGAEAAQKIAQDAERQAEAQRNGVSTPSVPAAGGTEGAAAPANNGTTPPSMPTTPTDGAAAATPGMKIPAGFPSDVPIQSGLNVTMPSWDNMSNTGGILLNGNVKSDDVVTYYTTNLPQNGWTQTGNNSIATTTLLQYTKDTRKLVVQVTAADNGAGATVMITVAKKE